MEYVAFFYKNIISRAYCSVSESVNMIIAFTMCLAIYFLLSETRGSKILEDLAQKRAKQTGIPHIAVSIGGDNSGLSVIQLFKTTASRPIVFLLTEPVVAAMATWAALLYVQFFIVRYLLY